MIDSGEGEEKPLIPLQKEDLTGLEYGQALANLRRFASKDLAEISSLDDLSFEMRFVGRSLRAAILSNGKVEEDRSYFSL